MIFYCIFDLPEAFTTRIHIQKCAKTLKKSQKKAAGTVILPQKAKVLLFPPPLLAESCLIYMGGGTQPPGVRNLTAPNSWRADALNVKMDLKSVLTYR